MCAYNVYVVATRRSDYLTTVTTESCNYLPQASTLAVSFDFLPLPPAPTDAIVCLATLHRLAALRMRTEDLLAAGCGLDTDYV